MHLGSMLEATHKRSEKNTLSVRTVAMSKAGKEREAGRGGGLLVRGSVSGSRDNCVAIADSGHAREGMDHVVPEDDVLLRL